MHTYIYSKYLGTNLTKEIKNLYNKNYKPFLKEFFEIEEDRDKWKDIPCSWIGRFNTAKMSIFQKKSTDLMQSLSKFQ